MAPQQPPHHHHNNNHLTTFIQTTTSHFTSFLTPTPKHPLTSPPSTVFLPLPLLFSESTQPTPPLRAGSGFPSMVRIGGLKKSGGGPGPGPTGGGPAFVGQVFSMCDLTGTGLMAVSSHFHIPFISNRTPDWLKKMFSAITKKESGPVFRFFMDLGDAVSYVRRLNIPSGIVGACRLDLAYEHFKEKPHLFQFVPNSRQVKAASRLLKGNQRAGGRKIDGVPVFSAQNLDIAIATPEGIKWYTPYFFDKGILDNILEESVDQHFHSLIQSRHVQRRSDVVDDNLPAEVIEESAESLWEATEVQDLMDEMGQSGIPLSVISKAAEMQLLYAVDKVLLGNRWLRKATGIQPKFPYMVDSFERRSAASWTRASKLVTSPVNSDVQSTDELLQSASSKLDQDNKDQSTLSQQADLRFSLGDWLSPPWLKPHRELKKEADSSMVETPGCYSDEELQGNALLPRITMVGIATTEPGQMSKATMKKTMEDLSKELEQEGRGNSSAKSSPEKYCPEDRDPLFVANVGDYYSNMGKTSSPRWLRGVHS